MGEKKRGSRVHLKQVSVPRHCPKSWDDMEGGDKVRLCGSCSTNVYNLSAMSEDEADRIVDMDEACVRYFYRPDGTIVSPDSVSPDSASPDSSGPVPRSSSRLAIGAAVALAYPAAFVGLSAMVGESNSAGHVSVKEQDGIKLAMGVKIRLRVPQEFTEEDLAELEQLEEIEMHEVLNPVQQRRMQKLRTLELRIAMREASKADAQAEAEAEAEAEADGVAAALRTELDEVVSARATATRRQLDAMLMNRASRNAGPRQEEASRSTAQNKTPQQSNAKALTWSNGRLPLGLGFLFLLVGRRAMRSNRLQGLDTWSVPQVSAVLSLFGAAAASTLAGSISFAALGLFSLELARRAARER